VGCCKGEGGGQTPWRRCATRLRRGRAARGLPQAASSWPPPPLQGFVPIPTRRAGAGDGRGRAGGPPERAAPRAPPPLGAPLRELPGEGSHASPHALSHPQPHAHAHTLTPGHASPAPEDLAPGSTTPDTDFRSLAHQGRARNTGAAWAWPEAESQEVSEEGSTRCRGSST